MEIIRTVWSKNNFLKDIIIVHSFNGNKEWWPEKYLEDDLLYLDNPGHFAGAEILLNKGMEYFSEKYSDVDYVVILASDTWLLKPEYLEKIILSMQKDEKYLATCPWGTKEKDNMWNIGMAIDFCIVNLKWAMKYEWFPIRYQKFVEKYSEIFNYRDEIVFLERVFALRFRQAILKSVKIPSENLWKKVAESYIYRMKDREPVHNEQKLFGVRISKYRKMYWKAIGLLTHHEPAPKRTILRKMNIISGKYTQKLIEAKDLSYYNSGVQKTVFKKGNNVISSD
jgi:hypothetical protein